MTWLLNPMSLYEIAPLRPQASSYGSFPIESEDCQGKTQGSSEPTLTENIPPTGISALGEKCPTSRYQLPQMTLEAIVVAYLQLTGEPQNLCLDQEGILNG